MSRGVWPLIGRDRELAVARAALRRDDGPRGLVLRGPAGIGKTRLAREIAARFVDGGATTRWVTGTSTGRQIPLGAFAPFVGDISGNPLQLLRRARSALLRSRANVPVVVCVDDAHLLDDVSALLLLQIALDRSADIVVTVRSGESEPDPVAALWVQDVVPCLEVSALDDAHVSRLITLVLGGEVADESSRRLRTLSGGNVLFLKQIIDGELSAGRLAQRAGRWSWRGDFAPSSELSDLIAQRLGRLPAGVVDVVDVLAISGRLDLATLARTCPTLLIEAGERAGVIETSQRGAVIEVAPAHPLFAEVRRAQLGRVAARRLRGRVAAALGSDESTPATVVRRALLLLDSDQPPGAPLLVDAARAATGLLHWSLAERFARAAIDAGAADPAELVLAYALSFTGRGEEADRRFAELSARTVAGVARTELIMSRAAHNFWMLGQVDVGISLARDEHAAAQDDATRDQFRAMIAMFDACCGRIDAASTGAGASREASCTALPVAALCRSWALTSTYGMTGRIDEYKDFAMKAYRTAGTQFQLGQPRIGLASHLVLALVLAGHLTEADDVSDEVARDIDPGLGYAELSAAIVRGLAALAAGRVRSCYDLTTTAVAGMEAIGESEGWIAQGSIPLAVAAALLGDHAAADATLARLERHRHPAHGILDPDLHLARGWVAACGGETSAAIDCGHHAAMLARSQGQTASELVALHTLIRFGAPPDVARIDTLSTGMSGPRPEAIRAHAAALADGDAPGLLQAARLFDAFGDRLSAADAAAQAATVFDRSARPGSALGALQYARRLQAACDAVRTPALRDAVQPVRLTRREQEVTILAAKGLSNCEIASRLVVSVRTVEGHLYRAGHKLGVRHRGEYADLLTPVELPDARTGPLR